MLRPATAFRIPVFFAAAVRAFGTDERFAPDFFGRATFLVPALRVATFLTAGLFVAAIFFGAAFLAVFFAAGGRRPAEEPPLT